jgi:hypothetical protein
MANRNQQLGADQRSSDGGVYVAINQGHIRFALQHHGFEPPHDLGGLHGVTARADLQIEIWFRNLKLGKEHIGHVPVIVLPGMNERLPDTPLTNGAQYGCRFDKIRTGSNNMKNMIHWVNLFSLLAAS